MFIFKKARTTQETLNELEAYIESASTEPIEWLAREVNSWGKFSYAEIEAAIVAGYGADIVDWQARYAKVINEKFSPMWIAAMAAGATKSLGKFDVVLDDSDVRVKNWLFMHGGHLITQLSDESRKALMLVITRGQDMHIAPREIAKQIRPLIGLNAPQARANANYRDRVYKAYLEAGLNVSQATAKANQAAAKYASKQQRYRAETIVHTELSFAYNRGHFEGTRQAIRAGYMGDCEKVWSTAGTNRVCGRCMELKGKAVPMNESFGEVDLPPLHPRCRCTIIYRELGSTGGNNSGKPPNNSSNKLGVLGCKNFSELRQYWADNYNVKVAKSIDKLHFQSVRTAMAGVEKIISEFMPAGMLLNEFDTLEYEVMSTRYGGRYAGIPNKINFSPDYFDNPEHLNCLIEDAKNGFRPKNTGVFEAGAHEMGHILEDWLAYKYNGTYKEFKNRVYARRIIQKAYTNINNLDVNKEYIFQMEQKISEYATKNLSECMAEAISDYIANGENAAILSREIWKALKEELD